MSDRPNNWSVRHKHDVERQAQLMKNEKVNDYYNSLHRSNWKQSLEIGKDENWYPFNETRNLDGITSPILYIVDEGDKAETKGTLFYTSIKDGVHVSIIPFASHLVHTEQSEIYSQILEEFLIKVDN
ncbi:alpha/beta fold hydrolase [Radiobacillus deserti]|uniref:alpha/beta fold hydrolase n=1 Tax=Radiobacillus deserti TaxID=2594883 RepID=UPI001E3B9D32|nr:alpha/beta hydrolase [Radiobacillus deserti]